MPESVALGLVCWRCGGSVNDLPQPLSRTAECRACRADLHTCKMCKFFAPNVRNGCREPVAEPITDKERANFCAFFQAALGPHHPQNSAAAHNARAQLDALFGAAPATSAPTPSSTSRSAADVAREQLELLFGKKHDCE